MVDEDDDPAVLTKAQRRYLRGEELSSAQERAIRSRIRKRVRAAVIDDIPLVLDHLEPEEIFDPDGEGTVTGRQLTDALPSMVALAYRLADAAGLDPEDITEDGVDLAKQSRAEYLMDVFHEDPGLLNLHELKHLQETGMIDEVEEARPRYNRLESIGIEIPEMAWEQLEIAERAKEEGQPDPDDDTDALDEYGTGVQGDE